MDDHTLWHTQQLVLLTLSQLCCSTSSKKHGSNEKLSINLLEGLQIVSEKSLSNYILFIIIMQVKLLNHWSLVGKISRRGLPVFHLICFLTTLSTKNSIYLTLSDRGRKLYDQYKICVQLEEIKCSRKSFINLCLFPFCLLVMFSPPYPLCFTMGTSARCAGYVGTLSGGCLCYRV